MVSQRTHRMRKGGEMRNRRRTRLFRRLLLGLAVAAMVAPAAQARLDEGGPAQSASATGAATGGPQYGIIRLDEGATTPTPRNRAHRGLGPVDGPARGVEPVSSGDADAADWTRVGIGAGLGGLALLAAGLAIAVTRGRRPVGQAGDFAGSAEETVHTKVGRRTRHA